MNKKILLVMLAVLLIVPASAFALDFIGLRIGPAAMYRLERDAEDKLIIPELGDITKEDLRFGVDARLNLTILEGNVLALVDKSDTGSEAYWTITTYANAGLSLRVFPFLRLGVFAGPKFDIYYSAEDGFDLDGVPDVDGILGGGVNIKVSGDFAIGKLSLSTFGIAETNVKFEELGDSGLDELFTSPKVSVGASVLFNIF